MSSCTDPTPDPFGSKRYCEGADTLNYEARLGKVTFDHYCAVCHGSEGKGDGFNAYNLNPHPRDLTDPAFQDAIDDRHLADVIRFGGTYRGSSNLMPAWVGNLKESEMNNLISYLRSLRN